MPSTTGTARTADGIGLLTRHWPPARPRHEARAAILIVHGLGEHSGRYEHVGDALAGAGFEVTSYDQRGFGGSGGRRAWVDSWTTVLEDLEARLSDVRARAGQRPVVLYGHSLGGLIALGYTLSGRARPDLLVLSAPAIEDRLAGWRRTLVTALDRLLPRLAIDGGIRPPMLVSAPRAGFRYVDDPLVETKVTVHFGALGLAEQARVRAVLDGLDRLPVPTFDVHGSDDPIVPLSASARLERFAEVTRIVYPGLRHETHNEASSRTVVDVVDWLDGQLSMLESKDN